MTTPAEIEYFNKKHKDILDMISIMNASDIKTMLDNLNKNKRFREGESSPQLDKIKDHIKSYTELRSNPELGYMQFLELKKYEQDLITMNKWFKDNQQEKVVLDTSITSPKTAPWETNGFIANVKQYGVLEALGLFFVGFNNLLKSTQASILATQQSIETVSIKAAEPPKMQSFTVVQPPTIKPIKPTLDTPEMGKDMSKKPGRAPAIVHAKSLHQQTQKMASEPHFPEIVASLQKQWESIKINENDLKDYEIKYGAFSENPKTELSHINALASEIESGFNTLDPLDNNYVQTVADLQEKLEAYSFNADILKTLDSKPKANA